MKTGEETGGKHAAFDYRNTATSLAHNGCAAALLKLGNARLHLHALQLQAAAAGCCCGRQSRSSRYHYHTHTTTFVVRVSQTTCD